MLLNSLPAPASSLPYLGRNDLFANLDTSTPGSDLNASALSVALCPSGIPDETSPPLLYGINAGTSHTTVYKAHDGAVVPNDAGHRKSLDEISVRDGLAHTWFTADSTAHLGVQGSTGNWHSWSATSPDTAGLVRFLSDTPLSPVLNAWGTPGGAPPPLNAAPPRSLHPGGVVVTFCDGRSKFIKEDLSARVYAHLSTSHSVWTGSAYDSAHNSNRGRAWLVNNPTGEPLRIADGVDY